VLRHQQVGRPRFTAPDRIVVAMLAGLLPRGRWPAFLVTLGTLLRWHHETAAGDGRSCIAAGGLTAQRARATAYRGWQPLPVGTARAAWAPMPATATTSGASARRAGGHQWNATFSATMTSPTATSNAVDSSRASILLWPI
jgi:hypothetical protein